MHCAKLSYHLAYVLYEIKYVPRIRKNVKYKTTYDTKIVTAFDRIALVAQCIFLPTEIFGKNKFFMILKFTAA